MKGVPERKGYRWQTLKWRPDRDRWEVVQWMPIEKARPAEPERPKRLGRGILAAEQGHFDI